MKKLLIPVLVNVFAVVLFSGCGNAVISNNGEMLLSETSIANTEFPEPIDNGSDTADIVTWQKIYAALLRDFAEQFTDEWGNVFGYFLVHDIDMDGTPELVIFEADVALWMLRAIYAYTLTDGELQAINLDGFPEIVMTGIYVPLNNDKGVITVSHCGDIVFYEWIVFESGRLAISTVGVMGLSSGYPFDMFWEIGGEEVTEYKFWSVFKFWDEWETIVYPITEANIYNLILSIPLQVEPDELSQMTGIIPYPKSWQEAFAEVLRFYAAFDYIELEKRWRFALHDIDRDGTPELFVAMELSTGHYDFRYVYTFVDGFAVRLEFAGFWTDGGIFAPIDGSPWVVAFLAAGSGGIYLKLEMIELGLAPVAEGSAFLSDAGHSMSAEDGIEWWLYFWHNLTISGNEVTRDEFENMFGTRSDRVWLEFFDIHDENISRKLYYSSVQTIEETTEWTVEELSAKIEAAGVFWNDWWWGRGWFASEHIVAWGVEEVPEHLATVYLRLLPTSGFESIDDIRNYLLQYYTESWVDVELSREFAAFAEYDSVLYINIVRMCFGDRNWETAEHILVEQDGSRAIVETTVIVWHGEVAEYYEHRYRFTFINGKIAHTNMQHTQ